MREDEAKLDYVLRVCRVSSWQTSEQGWSIPYFNKVGGIGKYASFALKCHRLRPTISQSPFGPPRTHIIRYFDEYERLPSTIIYIIIQLLYHHYECQSINFVIIQTSLYINIYCIYVCKYAYISIAIVIYIYIYMYMNGSEM